MSPASQSADDQLDAAAWCRHLVPDGLVCAFLADYRHELFPPGRQTAQVETAHGGSRRGRRTPTRQGPDDDTRPPRPTGHRLTGLQGSWRGVWPPGSPSANYRIDPTNRIDPTTPNQQAPRRVPSGTESMPVRWAGEPGVPNVQEQEWPWATRPYADGEVLEPRRVPDCRLDLLLDQSGTPSPPACETSTPSVKPSQGRPLAKADVVGMPPT